MLTPDQIKPHLLHEDRHVRGAAAGYFAESRPLDADLVPMVLDACERFGDAENIRGLVALDRLALTGPAFDRLLGHLARAEDARAIGHLNRAIAAAPADLLIAREAAVRATPNLDPGIVPRLDRRRELAGWSGERLWQELRDFAESSKEAATTGDLDLEYAEDLVEALARHDVPDDATVVRLIRELEPEEGWLEIFLIDLAGERRIAAAVPALVDKYRIDTDYLLERTTAALARIGDPEASRLIGAAYPTSEEHCRYYAPSALGAIKHPDSESALLAALEVEEDETLRTILCMNLCELFSERGVEVVREEIRSGYDDFLTSLEDELLPVLDVLGIATPEADRWRREREDRERAIERRLAELERTDWTDAEQRAMLVETLGRLANRGRSPADAPDRDDVPTLPVTAPIHREGPRVGRNDPCPCGSGKKFKKCCGAHRPD